MEPASGSRRVLKAGTVPEAGTQIAFNMEDLHAHCQTQLALARSEAQKIIEQARQDAAQLRQQLLQQAREEGRREGLRNAEESIEKRARELAEERLGEHLKATLPALEKAVNDVIREKQRWLAEWEQSAVRLALAVAERILRRQLACDPEAARDLIASALQLAAGEPHVDVRMHPDDVAHLGNLVEEIAKTFANCGRLELRPDPGVSRGGCIVETRHGTIDARLETQLDRIASELLHQFPDSADPPSAPSSTGS